MSSIPANTKKTAKNLSPMTPVDAKPGQPLYATVKKALIQAIDDGHFPPDKRLPSTKDLSEQMSVSLVTAHRALRELVGEGFLDRARGKGTFVVDRAVRATRRLRICIMIDREVSLVDEHHSRLVEGMRQASANRSPADTQVELTVSQYGTRVQDDWDGFLLLDPLDEDLKACLAELPARAAKMVVGSASHDAEISSVSVDNGALAELLIDHLAQMGHEKLAFLGSARLTGGNRDLWEHFQTTCDQRGLELPDSHAIRVKGWRLGEQDKMRLFQLLGQADGPTAIVTGGYHFSLDVYEAAATLGRSVPDDLSVIGIGNPASAAHLAPPLTCAQQPLVELGHAAISAIAQAIDGSESPATTTRALRPELIVRKSVTRR
ncbi:MAG: GntR family transcriptional regulator [Planctomycetota bacterium]